MTLRPYPLALCCLLVLPSGSPWAHSKAHQHGVGALDVALDGSRVELRLELPGDSVVGFEHPPGDAAQVAAIAKAEADLRGLLDWVGLPAAASCRPLALKVEVPAHQQAQASQARHGHDHGHDHHRSGNTDHLHADWVVDVELDCGQPDSLDAFDLSVLFQRFPGIEQINVQVANAGGQHAVRLRPGGTRLPLASP